MRTFVEDLDDLVIDVPRACQQCADIIAALVVENILELSCLEGLEFLQSYRAAEFIGQILSEIARKADEVEGGDRNGPCRSLPATGWLEHGRNWE